MLNKKVRNHKKTHVERNKEGIFFSVEIIEHTVTDLPQVTYKICSQTGNRFPVSGVPILYFCFL